MCFVNAYFNKIFKRMLCKYSFLTIESARTSYFIFFIKMHKLIEGLLSEKFVISDLAAEVNKVYD